MMRSDVGNAEPPRALSSTTMKPSSPYAWVLLTSSCCVMSPLIACVGLTPAANMRSTASLGERLYVCIQLSYDVSHHSVAVSLSMIVPAGHSRPTRFSSALRHPRDALRIRFSHGL